MVTPDEVDPRNMRMIARINGEVWSDGNSGTGYWTWPQIIELEVEGIGILRNRVGEKPAKRVFTR